ncbi:MAG: ubiquinol-cytochrome c reductase iron-sulfur subunit [Verrucomicrobiia bacterium]
MHQFQGCPREEGLCSGPSSRRKFLAGACSVGLGALAVLPPVAAGVMVVLDPLRKAAGTNALVRVTTLDLLPEDGVPRKLPIVASQTDAWTKSPSTPIGAVYLRRTGPKEVKAFNVVCPHLGCYVEFEAGRQGFICPCHNSAFGLDGSVSDPKSPSPRGLDELEVEIRNESEVWVKFQNFLTSQTRKIPVA